jgi:uncharacterized UBP type Zn finger protein
LNIDKWFPTPICLIENLIEDKENKNLIKEIEKLKKIIKKEEKSGKQMCIIHMELVTYMKIINLKICVIKLENIQ